MNSRETKKFRSSLRRSIRRGKKIEKLKAVITSLSKNTLSPVNRDHALKGNWAGHRECHIEGDWILVYRWEEDLLILVDTGSHADVFGM